MKTERQEIKIKEIKGVYQYQKFIKSKKTRRYKGISIVH